MTYQLFFGEARRFLLRKVRVEQGSIDPFGGAKTRLLRRGKEASLRVNPEKSRPLVRLIIPREVEGTAGESMG